MKKIKILAISDIHSNTDVLKSIREPLKRCDFVIVAGDFTRSGRKEDAVKIVGEIRSINQKFFAVAGNMDSDSVANYLKDEGISIDGEGKLVEEIGFLGVSGLIMIEDEMYSTLERGWSKIEKAKFKVIVSHFPPSNTRVDLAFSGEHIGSRVLRRFIEEHEPDICIVGHVHESPGEDRIGKTLIFNPGPLFEKRWLEIEISSNTVSGKLCRVESGRGF